MTNKKVPDKKNPPEKDHTDLKLPDEFEEVLEFIPEGEQRERAKNTLLSGIQEISLTHSSSYIGPLPTATEFESYERTVPGSGDRILRMAEDQMRHRHRMEETYTPDQIKTSKRGQWFSLVIGVLGIGSATILGILGSALVGSIIGGVTIGTIITAFIIGSREN